MQLRACLRILWRKSIFPSRQLQSRAAAGLLPRLLRPNFAYQAFDIVWCIALVIVFASELIKVRESFAELLRTVSTERLAEQFARCPAFLFR